MNEISVSIVVVSWNSLPFLRTCLDSILGQVYRPISVVVIDNASEDGTQEWITKNYPGILLKCCDKNLGFAFALNEGIRTTDAPFILSVNPDVILRPDCLGHLVKVMLEAPKVGIIAPKLLRSENNQVLDSTGLFINRSRCPYDRGQGELDHGQYDQSRKIFGACGALALYRREMFEELAVNNEYFDEDFFAYYEDADLAWRAQLCGWQAIYEPLAVGSHVRGWGDSLRKQRKKNPTGPRLALRNRYLMSVKNDRVSSFIIDFPIIFASEVPRLLYAAIYMPPVLLGIFDFFKLFQRMVQKRRYLWGKEMVKKSNFRPWIMEL
ncbi:MAG: glycosyltransferase family 2 protein [Anaerolineales bacterium]|nr:MAG: glycosyltransferase family 2 protein [Anaerolineales bacterium]